MLDFLSSIVIMGGRVFIGLFTDDADVVEIGLRIMRVISPSYVTYICIEILGGTARFCS